MAEDDDRSDTMSIAPTTTDQVYSDNALEHFEIPCKYITAGIHDETEPPAIRAAADPDPRILKAVLRYGHARYQQRYSTLRDMPQFPRPQYGWSEAPFLVVDLPPRRLSDFGPHAITRQLFRYNTPLLQAIRSQLPENVKTLLNAGANPNGLSWEEAALLTNRHLRFGPSALPLESDTVSRDLLLSLMDHEQLAPLTDDEIEDRLYDTCIPFWTGELEAEEPLLDVSGNGEEGSYNGHLLVEAARGASIEIFDLLMEKAESDYWMKMEYRNAMVQYDTSSFSLSTPLHSAIESGNMDMLRHLLKRGFDPNVQPLDACPTRCFTPAMATIILRDPWNEEAFNKLNDYCADLSQTTPVYGVHFLHFAVARLDISIVQACERLCFTGPSGIMKPTALGHTLLHVACMPANSTHIQRYSKAIFESIHEVRFLSLGPQKKPASCKRHHSSWSYIPCYQCRGIEPEYSSDMEDYFPQQTAMVQYLMESDILCSQDLYCQDVHGNTALHYLAGHKYVNLALLGWLLARYDVKNSWTGVENRYGYTAAMLFDDGLRAAQDGRCFDLKPWFKRRYSVMRAKIKDAVWERLLEEIKDEVEYAKLSRKEGDLEEAYKRRQILRSY